MIEKDGSRRLRRERNKRWSGLYVAPRQCTQASCRKQRTRSKRRVCELFSYLFVCEILLEPFNKYQGLDIIYMSIQVILKSIWVTN